jgi:hypothetical protein
LHSVEWVDLWWFSNFRCDLSPILNISLLKNYSYQFPYRESQCEVNVAKYEKYFPPVSDSNENKEIPVMMSPTSTPTSGLGVGIVDDTYQCSMWDYDNEDYDVTATSEVSHFRSCIWHEAPVRMSRLILTRSLVIKNRPQEASTKTHSHEITSNQECLHRGKSRWGDGLHFYWFG